MILCRFNNILLFIFACGVLSVSSEIDSNRDQPSPRKVHECKLTSNQYPVNVLPGSGWDNLENKELGQVLEISYKGCLGSNDGSFLIPDDVVISPIKKSIVELTSEIFDHFSNFTSSTAMSINADASYATPTYKISGSFSFEKIGIKNDQIKTKSSISRSQLRHELYKVTHQPHSRLDPKFRNRILDIGALLKEGKDTIYPQYLADLIVRDFGTHVIRSVDAGAILSKTDILKSNYVKSFKGDTTKIAAAASFSMTTMLSVNLKGSYLGDTTSLKDFNDNSASTKVETIGGRPFGSNFKLEDWENTLETNLVAIDRKGEPLPFAITPKSLPEFDEKIVNKIATLIKEAVNRYYAANTRVGCMNMESDNFNDDANIDAGNCEPPKSYYNFGGSFQTCSGPSDQCENLSEKNILTNDFTCPSDYEAVQLQGGLNTCIKYCVKRFFITTCEEKCSQFALYWCASTNQTKITEGALFGGFYTDTFPNPLTNTYSCPQYYVSTKFGINAKICTAPNKAEAIAHHLPFGGFYSCKAGNPLLDNDIRNITQDPNLWPQGCATGYSSHVAIVNRGCQISYCVKNNALSMREQPPLYRPPFIDLGFGPNTTVITSLDTPTGVRLFVDGNGKWSSNHQYGLSNFNIIIISVIIAAGVSIAIIITVLGIQRINRNRKGKILPEFHEFTNKNGSTNNVANLSLPGDVPPCRVVIE